ncbi:hypothetical protein [Rhodopseudomonas palustris]|uniref:hypothetical protein n=1 Tax=Rhodopseudomonas palustris TaxID=1076 RepID=UPI000A8E1A4A|nr:hypothetical protein [Rhodopseudomonas palustris]
MPDQDLKYLFSVELSERECGLIGLVVTQWGAMEYEIFHQTLRSFDEEDNSELPKAMNNVKFSQVLDLWKEKVVEVSAPERRDVLRKQLSQIKHLLDYRNALVHGMLKWNADDLDRITAIRVRKKEILSVHFTAEDLFDFQQQLASINYFIRYPLGLIDRAAELEKVGGYVSRAGAAMLAGHALLDQLQPGLRAARKGGRGLIPGLLGRARNWMSRISPRRKGL